MVRGGSHDALGLVAGVMGIDVYAMVGGKILNHSLSLESLGITSNCTVSFFPRLRGGSRDNVPGQWTCSNCLAERCWPVRTKCYRCGAPRHADSAPWNDKKEKVPEAPWVSCSSEITQCCAAHVHRPHVVPPRGAPPVAGVGNLPLPTPLDAKSNEDRVSKMS